MNAGQADPDYVQAITTNPEPETLFLQMDAAGIGVTMEKRWTLGTQYSFPPGTSAAYSWIGIAEMSIVSPESNVALIGGHRAHPPP